MKGKISKVQRFVARVIHRRQILNAKYNPRKIKAANRARLRKSVSDFGLVTTLIWNKRTGNLVGGHRRLEEIDAIEATDDYSLTVAEIDIDSLREKALNLILNNPAAQGEYDDKLLSKVLQELAGKIDIELTGFDEADRRRPQA